MATRKQLRANRANAQRSTGPRTTEGKATSRMNAVSHGILSESLVVPRLEREEEWDAHRESCLASLQPQGGLEEMLAERVIHISWRIRRVARYERDEIAKNYSEDAPRYWHEMAELGVAGGRQLPDLAKLGPITRYEAHLHRSLMQSLHELERIQARRLGHEASAPTAIDIVVTGAPEPNERIE